MTTRQGDGINWDAQSNTNITLRNGTTVSPGDGVLFRGGAGTGSGTPRILNLTATGNVSLQGDVLVGAFSVVNINLLRNSALAGAIQNANAVAIDGASRWNMTGNSTIDSLNVISGARVNFISTKGNFKTLVTNSLTGNGGIFGMNVNLPAFQGDLLAIQNTSQGAHSLSISNLNQGADPAPNKALLVVTTGDGQAQFRSNLVDAGTFKYEVQRGNGLPATPNENNWYLVRGDEVTPEPPGPEPSPTPVPPGPGPSPTPAPTPPPGPSEPEEVFPPSLDPIQDLTNTANAAIGTYSSTIPLYYADMQTLVERIGELRLGIETAPALVSSSPQEVVPGKGVVESKQVAPPSAPPRNEWGFWIRGFGNGMKITNNVSRSFDQNVGGFQIGADKRFGSLWSGDVYIGLFAGYIHAWRDFHDGGNSSTNALSLGTYATWIHPHGWYADAVLKFTEMWNEFQTTTSSGSTSTGNYQIPTFGGSFEFGKRFDFADKRFFIEPQAQLAGVWENGMDYTASDGLRVHGEDQTSLQGRLGGRVGVHFELSQGRPMELYAKAEVIEEFLTGNTVTTDNTNFTSSLSGTVGRFGGGCDAKLSDSIYIFGEYDYATGNHIQQPWSVSTGLRWAAAAKRSDLTTLGLGPT